MSLIESKSKLLNNGIPTSSFCTGTPKFEGMPNNSNNEQHVNIKEHGELSTDIENSKNDIVNNTNDMVTNNISEKLSEYGKKVNSLQSSISTKINEYKKERLNKIPGDKDEFGNLYITKMDLGSTLSEINTSVEDTIEQMYKTNNNATNAASKYFQEKSVEISNSIKQLKPLLDKIMTHTLEGADWINYSINKQVSIIQGNAIAEIESAYNDTKKMLDTYCKQEGNKQAEKIIREHNEEMKRQARNIIDNKRKTEQQTKIKNNAAIQKSKLNYAAINGLQ